MRVTTSSTILIKRVVYTVPSRLIGESLRAHIYDNRLEIYRGSTLTVILPRIFVSDNNHRARQVDYRHVITSLERKQQAFRYSQLRDDLSPSKTYKAVWHLLEARKASKTMLCSCAFDLTCSCSETTQANHC